MFQLILCELHCPDIHGKTEDSDPNIENHYIVYDTFDPITKISHSLEGFDADDFEFDSITDCETIDEHLVVLYDEMAFLKMIYSKPLTITHPSIRNYKQFIARPDYIKEEIAETILLPSGEMVAILKTCWLRIFQRKWKRIFREKRARQ